MADEKSTLDVLDKPNVTATSDLESSGNSSPPVEIDELPDPDVGKSDEERARLVRAAHGPPFETPLT